MDKGERGVPRPHTGQYNRGTGTSAEELKGCRGTITGLENIVPQKNARTFRFNKIIKAI